LWQTMRRSLGTSISTLLVVVAMYFLGSWVIQTFAFTIGLGIVAGTFSSLFIAAPLMYLLMGKYGKERGKLT
jgi:preprotein translocase subunit SecF